MRGYDDDKNVIYMDDIKIKQHKKFLNIKKNKKNRRI